MQKIFFSIFILFFSIQSFASNKVDMINKINSWQAQTKKRIDVGIRALNAEIDKDVFSKEELKQYNQKIDDYAKKCIEAINKLTQKEITLMFQADTEKVMAENDKLIERAMKQILMGKKLYSDKEVKEAIKFDKKSLNTINMIKKGLMLPMEMMKGKLNQEDLQKVHNMAGQNLALMHSLYDEKLRKNLLKLGKSQAIKDYMKLAVNGTMEFSQLMSKKLMTRARKAMNDINSGRKKTPKK